MFGEGVGKQKPPDRRLADDGKCLASKGRAGSCICAGGMSLEQGGLGNKGLLRPVGG